jgi:hypothetical protein
MRGYVLSSLYFVLVQRVGLPVWDEVVLRVLLDVAMGNTCWDLPLY